MTYQLTEEVGDTTVGDISDQRKEEERPGDRVQESFLDLVELEMLVTNSLLVFTHTRDSQYPVLFLQPACVQLVIRYYPEENKAERDGQETRHEEDNLPRLNGGAVFPRANGNAVCDNTADDLSDAVETEPDVDPAALFFLGVPLRLSSVTVLG